MASSGEHRANHVSADVGEAEVAALKTISEPFVIESEEVQDRGVQIIYMHRIPDHAPANLIGFTNRLPALDPGAGHP